MEDFNTGSLTTDHIDAVTADPLLRAKAMEAAAWVELAVAKAAYEARKNAVLQLKATVLQLKDATMKKPEPPE